MNISRESIFISALRSFCNGFAAIFGIIIAAVILVVAISSMIKPSSGHEKTTMTISPDAEGNRTLLPDSSPAILRIDIHGQIGTRYLNHSAVLSELLDSREGALKNGRVKGIILHIDSPGGTAVDSNNIYMALEEYKEKYKVPIYAYIDGLCASGGMYIACSADKIYSNPTGMIGSVGVLLGPFFNYSGLMSKYGVSQITFTDGIDKDMLNPYRAWEPEEHKSIQPIIEYDYKRFVDIVVKARPNMDKDKLIHTYGAQIYDPETAEAYGYIDDGNATYGKALTELVKAAGIDGKYQVVELKVNRPVLSELIDAKSPLFSGKITHELQIIPEMRSEWTNKSLYLYSPALQKLNQPQQ